LTNNYLVEKGTLLIILLFQNAKKTFFAMCNNEERLKGFIVGGIRRQSPLYTKERVICPYVSWSSDNQYNHIYICMSFVSSNKSHRFESIHVSYYHTHLVIRLVLYEWMRSKGWLENVTAATHIYAHLSWWTKRRRMNVFFSRAIIFPRRRRSLWIKTFLSDNERYMSKGITLKENIEFTAGI
jgi:hypothetical protein